jgi:hypothetical protein
MTLNRRTFVKGVVSGLLASRVSVDAQEPSQLSRRNDHFRIWDVHSHLEALQGNTPLERMEILIRHMDKLGVERLMLSQGFGQYEYHPTPEQVRIENDRVMEAVRHFPDRAYGSLYLSPGDVDSSLLEFDRCIRDGPMVMIGELETDIRCNSPALNPLVERAISLNVPILQHTWTVSSGNGPGDSTPLDLVELAKRHPRGQFICGHTGGNWELGIRAIRESKNICAEIAGSDPTSGFTEMAVRELGAERVVYGSDVGGRSFASQIAKVLGAEISDREKELILGGNLRRLLQPVLKAKGLRT